MWLSIKTSNLFGHASIPLPKEGITLINKQQYLFIVLHTELWYNVLYVGRVEKYGG